MGLLTRLRARRANSQPSDQSNSSASTSAPAPAPRSDKPRKLVKKNPRKERIPSAEPASADHGPVSQDAWSEPPPAKPRKSWAESPYAETVTNPTNNSILATMKPLGEYPSPAEYRAVGLRPPLPRLVSKRTAKQSLRPLTELAEDVASDATMTPLAEEAAVSSDSPRVDLEMDSVEPTSGPMELQGAVEDVVGGDVMEDVADVEDVDTNLATPISEAVDGKQTAHASVSSVETPADEAAIQPSSTAPETQLIASDTATPLLDIESTPVPAAGDDTGSKNESLDKVDYMALLDSLPQPTSEEYDIPQLKRVLSHAISRSLKQGEHAVAMSLVYYWSKASEDPFLLSLLFNIGLKERDPELAVALKSIMKDTLHDAQAWYKQTLATDVAQPRDRVSVGGSDSGLSSAKSDAEIPDQPSRPVRTTATTVFDKGKSNTFPLKPAKKKAPCQEHFYKRKRSWNEDPNHEEEVRNKRARLVEQEEKEKQNAPVPKESALRSSIRKRRPAAAKAASVSQQAETEQKDASDDDRSEWLRSLSVDTTLSSISTLSNSAYSERFNDWSAPHEMRTMPNAM